MLQQLYAVVSQLNTCRFYASSLLIYYDAAEEGPVNVKMIDFAHSVSNADQLRPLVDNGDTSDPLAVPYPPTTRGPDTGYLLGLKSLISCFEEISSNLPM